MEKLLELSQIIRPAKISKEDLIIYQKNPKTNVHQFYACLIDGKFKSDQEAAQFFFNEDSTHSKYKNLKRYLKQKMYNMVFFVEPQKHYGAFNETYVFCCKSLFIAKILINLGARKSGIELCQKVFSKAIDFELSEFIVESSRFLRLHFGTRLGDKKKFDHFDHHYKAHAEILASERTAEEYYIRLTMPLVKSIIIDNEMIENAHHFYGLLQPDMEKYNSPILHFYGNYIKILLSLFKNDYRGLIRESKEAIAFFEAKNYVYANPLRVFYHNLLVGYTQLKMYNEGKDAVEKASRLVLSGTHSWYANKELHLALAFHSKEYGEIFSIIDSAYSHRKFKLLSHTVKERWSVYEAYAYFLVLVGKAEKTKGRAGKFRLGKFLNDIPVFSQDKRGLNIPILVLQIAFMVVRQEYGKTIDRFSAIEKYVTRHVKKRQNFRSFCFINMLLILPASGFNKIAVIRKSQSWYEQLQHTPLEIANQPHEIEIIPYEDFWDYILASLDNTFH